MHRSKQDTAYHASGIAQGGEPFFGLLGMIAQPARPGHAPTHTHNPKNSAQQTRPDRAPAQKKLASLNEDRWRTKHDGHLGARVADQTDGTC